jgi:TolB-like protein/cytochrome c-type biogenesis protein CcmH/NrfG
MPTHDLLRSKIAPQDSAASAPPISVQVLPALNKRSADLEFEIGHVLFIDIVGYSKLLLNEQSERLRILNEVVRGTRQFQRADAEGTLVRLPTGDGMALVFRNSPEGPAQCALEISKSLKAYPQIQLRMGIHSGPVNEVFDVNQRANITGAGINIAQRVMDCGDAGHILLSKHVAEDLQHSARWQPHLHDLGEYEVKHGVVIAVVNLFTAELGNSSVPAKFARVKQRHPTAFTSMHAAGSAKRLRPVLIFSVLIAGSALIAALAFFAHGNSARSTMTLPDRTLPSAAIPEKSIAVLPFENLSANQETAFFTDGVQDEILTDLAKVADLKVISRTSVQRYRDLAKRNMREIAQQFGVAHVLEGSVQRAANRIRVNAQLIDTRTEAHLWAQTYDRDLADVFAIQSEIAKAIADQLQAKISAKEEAALDEKPTNDLAAYDLYLRAQQIERNRASSIASGGAEEARREVGLLDEAIKHDPSFVSAICLLVQTHLYLYWVNADQPLVHLDLAKQALEAAARLQPNGGEVHLCRAILYYWGARDYPAALAELASARHGLPNDIRVLFFTAMIERRQGNWIDATRHLERGLALDPCDIPVISELAGTYGVLRRYRDAAQILDSALAWKPLDFGLGFLRADVDMLWKADLRRWESVTNGKTAQTADPNDLITAQIDLALKKRDYRKAEQILAKPGGSEVDDNGFFTPREWKQAIVARGLGDQVRADHALASAYARATAAVREQPEDAKTLMVLAQIAAALGHKNEALQQGQRAIELLPVTKDAVNGYQLRARLVTIYAQVGETDRALELMEKGLHEPYGPTYGSLKLDGVWDPLRGHPRFAKLVAALAPKD